MSASVGCAGEEVEDTQFSAGLMHGYSLGGRGSGRHPIFSRTHAWILARSVRTSGVLESARSQRQDIGCLGIRIELRILNSAFVNAELQDRWRRKVNRIVARIPHRQGAMGEPSREVGGLTSELRGRRSQVRCHEEDRAECPV
jgi:hypothetical protein